MGKHRKHGSDAEERFYVIDAAGVGGWMVWDANNVYSAGAFGPAG
jgi:hypothetical protein